MSEAFHLSQAELATIRQDFKDKQVVIVGDVMCDAYWWGSVNRISPEAPVQVVDIDQTEYRLGGAANVALNIKHLGAEPLLCSVIGDGNDSHIFQELLSKEGIASDYVIKDENRPTTVKTRVMGEQHQLLRMDSETKAPLNEQSNQQLLSAVEAAIEQADAVLFIDYDKGILGNNNIPEIISKANEKGIPTAVDPKQRNFFSYNEASLFKPNLLELESNLGTQFPYPVPKNQLDKAVQQLKDQLQNAIAFITLSEQGVYITDYEHSHLLPAHLRTIHDVSGAGDTVMSVATLALASRCSIPVIAEMANLAGGLVCEKVGVVPIEQEAFFEECARAMVFRQSETLNVQNPDS